MNDERRKNLEDAKKQLQEAQSIIDAVKGEEEEALGNLPENLQEGERGERMQEDIAMLEEIDGQIEEALDKLEDVLS